MTRRSFGYKPAAGSLSPCAVPYTASVGLSPWGLALSPDGLSLYTFNNGGNSVGQYSLVNGIPVAMATPTVSAGGSGRAPRYGFVTPNNAWVICTHFADLALGVYPRNTSTGALGTVIRTAVATGPYGMGMANNTAATKYHIYVGHNTGSLLSAYEMDPTTGVLTLINTYACGLAVQDVTVSPDGLSVYTANSGSATLSIYDRNPADGTLTPKSPATIAVGSGPSKVIVSPDNKHVYASCNNAAALYQYSRDLVTSYGALAPLSPASITAFGYINGPYGMAMSANGNYVYMPSSDNNTILQLSRNSTSGLLTMMTPKNVHASLGATGISSGVAGPYGMITSADNKFAYCTMNGVGAGTQGVTSFNIK